MPKPPACPGAPRTAGRGVAATEAAEGEGPRAVPTDQDSLHSLSVFKVSRATELRRVALERSVT